MVARERRAFPRIADSGLSLKVQTGDFDTITHTLNLSASGVYCKLDREIPLMSMVKLKLMVPDASKPESQARIIETGGVVVRTHPVIIDGVTRHFDAAIFFQDLPEKDREIIKKYVARKVP
jgi:hypothetical protein